MSTVNTYTEPVSRLLTLGEPGENDKYFTRHQGRNYLELGISSEHIPDLIRMATDEYLNNETNWDEPDAFGPLHAWRALGQLRAEAAVEPLLSLLNRIDEEQDDWVGDDMPYVFGLIGPAAISHLATYLLDTDSLMYAKIAAVDGLKEIGLAHPDTRLRCVEFLTDAIGRESFADIDFEDARTVRGFVLSALLHLEGKEALPEIQTAFEKDWIDISIAGDFEDALIKLGELDERLTPKPNYHGAFLGQTRAPAPVTTREVELPPLVFEFIGSGKTPKQAQKSKSKKKMAKASKKKNRKR